MNDNIILPNMATPQASLVLPNQPKPNPDASIILPNQPKPNAVTSIITGNSTPSSLVVPNSEKEIQQRLNTLSETTGTKFRQGSERNQEDMESDLAIDRYKKREKEQREQEDRDRIKQEKEIEAADQRTRSIEAKIARENSGGLAAYDKQGNAYPTNEEINRETTRNKYKQRLEESRRINRESGFSAAYKQMNEPLPADNPVSSPQTPATANSTASGMPDENPMDKTIREARDAVSGKSDVDPTVGPNGKPKSLYEQAYQKSLNTPGYDLESEIGKIEKQSEEVYKTRSNYNGLQKKYGVKANGDIWGDKPVSYQGATEEQVKELESARKGLIGKKAYDTNLGLSENVSEEALNAVDAFRGKRKTALGNAQKAVEESKKNLNDWLKNNQIDQKDKIGSMEKAIDKDYLKDIKKAARPGLRGSAWAGFKDTVGRVANLAQAGGKFGYLHHFKTNRFAERKALGREKYEKGLQEGYNNERDMRQLQVRKSQQNLVNIADYDAKAINGSQTMKGAREAAHVDRDKFISERAKGGRKFGKGVMGALGALALGGIAASMFAGGHKSNAELYNPNPQAQYYS